MSAARVEEVGCSGWTVGLQATGVVGEEQPWSIWIARLQRLHWDLGFQAMRRHLWNGLSMVCAAVIEQRDLLRG